MTDLRFAAQQALEALEMSRRFVYADNRPQCDEAIDALRAALAEPEPCPNCASLEAQNTELDRKLAEVEQEEREACAKLAESTICDTHLPTGVRIYGTRVADAIRARSIT